MNANSDKPLEQTFVHVCEYCFFQIHICIRANPRLNLRLLLRDAVDSSHAPDQRLAVDT